MRRACNTEQGFTLVELIVVMAVLSVLALMAMQMFNKYVATVKEGRTIADIRTLEKAILAYSIDKNALPTTLRDAGVGDQRDPWLNLYEYRVLGGGAPALEDSAGVTLNTDYDLYSKGLDGVSAVAASDAPSADDIVRANDGQYAGPRAGL